MTDQELPPGADDQERRAVTRRAVVKAGWLLPAVLATASLPNAVFAQASPAACDPSIDADNDGVNQCDDPDDTDPSIPGIST